MRVGFEDRIEEGETWFGELDDSYDCVAMVADVHLTSWIDYSFLCMCGLHPP